MKRTVLFVSLIAALLAAPAMARNTKYTLPLADVLAMPEAKAKLDGSVKFYLAGDAKAPKVLQTLGEDTSRRKTNGVGKEDEFGCRWAMLSALMALEKKAKQLGANAVIDIVSVFGQTPFSSATEYECHAGAVVVGVSVKGTYAKVAD